MLWLDPSIQAGVGTCGHWYQFLRRRHGVGTGAETLRLRRPWACVLVLFAFPAAPPAPAERFALLIAGLCRAVAAQSAGGRMAGPLIVLIWCRLRRLGARFAGLV